MRKVDLRQKVLNENENIAIANRERFAEAGTFVLNLVSSPGSGKTRLIEETVKVLKDDYRIFVVTGDLMTENDAERIARHGVEAVQICTGEACHLDARMVDEKLLKRDASAYDLIVIENVGNLVCPASFDLGEDLKVLLVAVGEGDDKPVKYPPMVRASEVLVITKTDLAPYTDSNPDTIEENALRIKPDMTVFKTSSKTGEGLEQWIDWLRSHLMAKRPKPRKP
ncbi:MAG: hydrogenase nickel incorporation protein HypB [Candidatus Eisenbacteria bacterium]